MTFLPLSRRAVVQMNGRADGRARARESGARLLRFSRSLRFLVINTVTNNGTNTLHTITQTAVIGHAVPNEKRGRISSAACLPDIANML